MTKTFRRLSIIPGLVLAFLLISWLVNPLSVKASPGTVEFTSDVILNSSGLDTATYYIASGAKASSLVISGSDLTVSGALSNTLFLLKTADHDVLRITPSGGAADLSFSSNYFVFGWISRWSETSSVSVQHVVGVPRQNADYFVKADGVPVSGSPFNPGASSVISFTRTGSGSPEVFTVAYDEEEANVKGYAWTDNIGWISFDNDDPAYGLNIDSDTGKGRGNIWSDSVGWITFYQDGALGAGAPPSDDPCPTDDTCIAKLNSSYELEGWARAISHGGGWDGWIRLKGVADDSTPYGVTLNTDTKEFEGWAYGGDVVGWISFNDKTDTAPSPPDYQVYTIMSIGLGVTNPHDVWDLCEDTLHPTLNWEVAGGTPTGYNLEIYSDSGLTNLVYQYGTTSGSSTSHYPLYGADGKNYLDTDGTCSAAGENGFHNSPRCNLNYASTYWWQVQVKDDDGIWGDWSTVDTFAVVNNHHYPEPSFTTEPASPQTGSVTHLLDGTVAYGTATVATWEWTISGTEDTDYGYVNSTTDASANPDVQFYTDGSKTISLQVTDSDGYGACGCSGGVDVAKGEIQWYETPPTP